VSARLARQARLTDSAALEGDAAHLRADAMTSAGVLIALVLVEFTGNPIFDPGMAMIVAVAIVVSGLRIVVAAARTLLDEALPESELMAVRRIVWDHDAAEIEGFHRLRGRRAGSRRLMDLHVQFSAGTSLERAHELSHELARTIRRQVRNADVLIHLEPDDAAAGPFGPISPREWARSP
jgi:cation diffusion facilitator family transporter